MNVLAKKETDLPINEQNRFEESFTITDNQQPVATITFQITLIRPITDISQLVSNFANCSRRVYVALAEWLNNKL